MIYVIAGTSDARELAITLRDAGHDIMASVVTDNAAISLREANIETVVGRLTAEEMTVFIEQRGIEMIVDASHPFAEEASKNAVKASRISRVPYIRYEREEYQGQTGQITHVSSYKEAALLAKEKKGTVMLTTGSKTLQIFTEHLLNVNGVRLIARMLPRKDNMEKCEVLGVEQKNIVAIQGPFSKELNIALFKQYSVTLMITKESGKVGSVDEKVEAAKELNIPIVMISRPKIDYGIVCRSYEDVLETINQKVEV
ncbi:precorrin-6A reductase [Alkalihalobacterium chitinilyticum]|uniref:Precorrin-6A reductase n=1 Tax=Alkalihalobacterium chitinilyticum TaxID=2980103 RepID=A0ABT5V9M4_9BACI|nr:precorrin-6A reductase [Alkalihalobacterium chitinilyticum]MDE5412166.1 precorrin-6A reductase [Alkalihalobacterium chitinilyticum]